MTTYTKNIHDEKMICPLNFKWRAASQLKSSEDRFAIYDGAVGVFISMSEEIITCEVQYTNETETEWRIGLCIALLIEVARGSLNHAKTTSCKALS